MSLRIPVKAGDFLSVSRRTRVHAVNVRRVISGCDCYLKPSDLLGRLSLLLGVRLSWGPAIFVVSPRRVSGFCLILGHDRFLPLSVQLFIYRPSCHSSLCDKNRAGIAHSVQRRATGWTFRSSNPGGGEIFPARPYRPWGPPSLLYNGYQVSFPGVKWPGRVVDRPLPSSAEVNPLAPELFFFNLSTSCI